MKQYLSFIHLSNLLGSKMRKGMKNFCNGDDSTSTLNQHYPCMQSTKEEGRSPTLEEMILQLELEEEMARRSKLNENINGMRPGRMSCVNSSDILRSARNALNQYPRFSLDGKDAMYRASFRDFDATSRGRRSCERTDKRTLLGMPKTVGGQSVVWCKPGVVAQLMGLEEVPVPLSSFRVRGASCKESSSSVAITRRQNLRRRAERHEMERRVAMNSNNTNGCCSSSSKPPGYSVMKPVVAYDRGEGGWPTRRFY